MIRATKVLKGGLQDVADDLGVRSLFPCLAVSSQLNVFPSQVMRIGSSHQAGSDSLLTSSTFFKMRELYFNDHVDDAEYSGKLYGLGQTFSPSTGLTDPGRGGATIAEREDRSSARDAHNQTPAPNAQPSQNQNVSMSMGQTPSGSLPSTLPLGSYGPMGANNGPYGMRTSLVGGAR